MTSDSEWGRGVEKTFSQYLFIIFKKRGEAAPLPCGPCICIKFSQLILLAHVVHYLLVLVEHILLNCIFLFLMCA